MVRGLIKISKVYDFHKKYIEDVAFEVSQDNKWRKKLFEGKYDEKFLISYQDVSEIPKYLKTVFKQHKLEYYISKTLECPEEFDDNMVIFKFEAKDFFDLVRYSGNNERVV